MTAAETPAGIGNPPGAQGAVPLVLFEGITKSFGAVRALRGVDFELLPGEVHALLGQNGAGKSTLIKILSGVNRKDGGRMRVRGEDVEFRTPADSRDAGIAIVYQELSLVPSMSVAENLYLGREPHNRLGLVRRRQMIRDAGRFLEERGLPLDPRTPVENLPFAYRQLTEIAKALSGNVNVLVLDEPTSALSGGEEEILFDAIEQVTRRGVGVIYVTHRLGEVFRLSQRVSVLRDGANVGTFRTLDTDMSSLVAAIVGPRNEGFRQATIVGLGPQGEMSASPEEVQLTDEEATRAKEARFKVGIVLHTADSDWSSQQVRGITDALEEHGAEVIGVVDPAFETERQIAGIEDMIRRRPDAIIGIPVDNTATAEAYKKIGDAGIKLVLMDNAPKGLQAGKDYASVVSADNHRNGRIAAETLARYVPKNGTVGIIGFGVDFFATDEREIAFKKWLTDNRPDIEVKQTDFLDPNDAESVAAEFLTANPDVDGLFVVWDAPAMGAVSAARAQGKDLPITTVDLGNEVAIEMARGGMIKGVGAQVPYDQGVSEANATIKALLGEETPPWVALPGVRVTRENVIEAYRQVWHAEPPAELVEARESAAATDGAQPVPSTENGAASERAPLLELREVSNERLRSVDLTLAPGEILGLAGMVGSGRTEILETIFGLRRATSGELRLDGERLVLRDPTEAIQRGIALAPEDRHAEGLVLEHSIERNLALPRLPQLGRFGWFRRKASSARAEAAMRELSVKAPNPSTPVRNLSGGNQQKVVFGKWRDPTPTLLLLDEPTVGVDVGAREEIYGVVRRMTQGGSAVLVVSSELAELLLLCDRIGIVADGRVVKYVARAEVENEEDLHHLVQEAQREAQE